MIVALYILLALLIVGAILRLLHRPDDPSDQIPEPEIPPTADDECCGQHSVCEKDSLLAAVSPEIVYYDDEELDRFRGRGSNDYSESEIEEWRSVLLTLLPDDIAGWGRSIQLRGLQLPETVREELLMIISEQRTT